MIATPLNPGAVVVVVELKINDLKKKLGKNYVINFNFIIFVKFIF